MATPNSYLQSLSHDDARAFVASLQKVKDHLSGELEWMNQQVQQKTIQLQGIETLLSEALALGLMTTDAATTESASADVSSSILEKSTPSKDDDLGDSVGVEEPISTAYLNGNTTSSSTAPSDQTDASTTAAKPASTKTSKQNKSPKQTAAKAQPKSQSATASKAGKTNAKKPSPASKPKAKESKTSNNPDLRSLLQPRFKDKTFKEIVIQVLEDANKPLHLDEMVREMYGRLPSTEVKRVKAALMNVLWAGKGEGKWQNLGQGMYSIKNGASK